MGDKMNNDDFKSEFPSYEDLEAKVWALENQLTAAEMSVKDYRAKNVILREALERIAGTRIDGKACDIIADCKDYTEALEAMASEALQRAGGGE